jgi:Polysaccharide biosynthesis/export protein/SLBB domain
MEAKMKHSSSWIYGLSGPHLVFRNLAIGLSAALVAVLTSGAAYADYKLGPSDQLRVKVVEFNKDTLTPTEWAILAGDYRVDAQGNILMPIVGEIAAQGLTVVDLNKSIENKVRELIGFEEKPAQAGENPAGNNVVTASTEIIEYRPFYVGGAVRQPGAFPYRPGLTVLQAISIAGGQPAVAGGDGWSLERDAIAAGGELHGIDLKQLSLLAQQARLRAELVDAREIKFPASIGKSSGRSAETEQHLEQIKANETEIFLHRLAETDRQKESLTAQKALLESEVASLLDQVKAEQVQGKLVADELKSVNHLVDKGLTTTSRRLTLDRAAADSESKVLQLQTSVIQVRQDINRCERELAALLDKRRSDISASLIETQGALDELGAKRGTTLTLLSRLQTAGAYAGSVENGMRVVYSIVNRNEKGETTETFDVPETSPVEPGDTVKVTVEMPNQSAGIAPAAVAP